MAGIKDPAIKLFGKTISVTDASTSTANFASVTVQKQQKSSDNDDTVMKDVGSKEFIDVDDEDEKRDLGFHESSTNEEQSEESNSQEKTLKKPDKIIPCPRCSSMDTKFCYYNNYNVNQPRHFCKNCQRYWTAGGTMRNVPVGAGRRKNKQQSSVSASASASAAHYHNIFAQNGLHHPPNLVSNGKVLNFGSNLALSDEIKDLGVEKPSNLNSMALHYTENGQKSMNLQGLPLQGVPYFTAPSWPPGYYPPSFPVPFCVPPNYWGGNFQGSWPIPNYLNQGFLSSSPSSQLGKHSRNGEMVNSSSNMAKDGIFQEHNSERSVLVPKSVRIDDPREAAKSSIWETLGIKNEKTTPINKSGIFESFKSKGGHGECYNDESLSVLHANPAAMSRSLNFHETT